jgi:hypothetical protein
LGYSQSWQDVTVSRSAGTVYQNTTGKPISVSVTHYGGDGQGVFLYVDSSSSPSVVVAETYQIGAGIKSQLTAIVPSGFYYKVVLSGDSITRWVELRA